MKRRFSDLQGECVWDIFQVMTLTVNIPDDLAEELGAGFQNLGGA
jgi:hypothetical protein